MNTKLGHYCTSADLEDTNESLKTTHDNKSRVFAMQVWKWIHFIDSTALDVTLSVVCLATATTSHEKMQLFYEVAISYAFVLFEIYDF